MKRIELEKAEKIGMIVGGFYPMTSFDEDIENLCKAIKPPYELIYLTDDKEYVIILKQE